MNTQIIIKNWTYKMIKYWEDYLKENPKSDISENVKEAIKTLKSTLPEEK